MDAAPDFLSRVITWRDSEMPDEVTKVRQGSIAKPRDFVDRSRGISFRIHTADHPEEFFSPRHRHTFDQFRYMISGSCRYGNRQYIEGDFIYIPAGLFYGPMQLSENKENFKHVNMQYQGIAGIPYYGPQEFDEPRERLHNQGRFERGTFIWNDGRAQDAFEVLLAEKTGREVRYPEPPFADYLVVRSANIAWRPHPELEGVEVKHLGHFTEVGPNAQIVRMRAGVRTPPGRHEWQQMRCLLQGKLRFEEEPGEIYAPTSLRYVPPGVAYGATECVEDASFLLVHWAADAGLYPPATSI